MCTGYPFQLRSCFLLPCVSVRLFNSRFNVVTCLWCISCVLSWMFNMQHLLLNDCICAYNIETASFNITSSSWREMEFLVHAG